MTNSAKAHDSTGSFAPYPPVLDHRYYRTAAKALVLLLLGVAIYFVFVQRWYDAAAAGSLGLLGAAFLGARDRLPSLFNFLFLVAAAVNAAGYVFSLWKHPVWFDEAVHAGTSFTIMAAIAWLLLGRSQLSASGHTGRFIAAVVAIGIGLGIAWEVFEWVIGIIDGKRDTIVDLVMDTIGAVLAALFCAWAVGKYRKAGADGG